MKLGHILRRIYKYSFYNIKLYKKPVNNIKYGLIFLFSFFKKFQLREKSFGFSSIYAKFLSRQKFLRLINLILKKKLSFYYQNFHQFLDERKKYVLMKICLKISNLYDKFEYRCLSKSLRKMKIQGLFSPQKKILNQSPGLCSRSLYNIAFKGELGYNNFLTINKIKKAHSPFSEAGSPISPVGKRGFFQSPKTSRLPNKSKFFQSNKKTFKKGQNELKTRKSANNTFDKSLDLNFENLIGKSFDFDFEETKFPEIQDIQRFKKDFGDDKNVKFKLGLASFEKSLMNMIAKVYFDVLSCMKKPKTEKRVYKLNFLMEDSSNTSSLDDQDFADVEVVEKSEPKYQQSPWVLQLHNLGFLLLRKIAFNSLKDYYQAIVDKF